MAQQHVTFEHTLSAAFAHIGAAMDIFQSIPRPNGATTAALSNGHEPKALATQKVRKAAVKALPAPAVEQAPALPGKTKPAFGAKAAFVRSAPKTMSAKDVVAAASKSGITLTENYVYTVRSSEAKPGKSGPKPGRKRKAAATAAETTKTSTKPAKAKAAKSTAVVKVKAEKPVKAKPAKVKSAISKGRRAVTSGERPKLHDAVAIVMGDETLTAGVILERLKERGWEPGASQPQSYISYTLSDNAETFKRHKRGEYSVIKPKQFEKIAAQFKSGGKSSGKAERVASTDAGEAQASVSSEPVEATAVTAPEASPVAGDPPTTTPSATAASTKTDEAMAELGLGASAIGQNPFDA